MTIGRMRGTVKWVLVEGERGEKGIDATEQLMYNDIRVKMIATILCCSVMASSGLAQGLINFANTPTTLISAFIPGRSAPLISGPAGSYLFGLLISPTATGPFSFSGLYATNIVNSTGGRFSGGNGVAVNGWAPGTTMFYEIAGWASTAGVTFTPAWVLANGRPGAIPVDLFSISSIGSGVAGRGPQSLPPLPLFGGVSGITSGFAFGLIPEPTSMSLAGVGAVVLLMLRRRKTASR